MFTHPGIKGRYSGLICLLLPQVGPGIGTKVYASNGKSGSQNCNPDGKKISRKKGFLKIVILHLLVQGPAADLQHLGCPGPIPACFFQGFTDEMLFGRTRGVPDAVLEALG